MGNLAQESHIPWAHLDPETRPIRRLWVSQKTHLQLVVLMYVAGVIPRAAISLFEKLDGSKPSNNRNSVSGLRAPARYSTQMPPPARGLEKNWTLKATYVEIYNETLRDLLVPDHTPQHERGQVTIREDKGHILLTGLHQLEINSVDDLMGALNFGSSIRQTDSTAINAKSSRSHAVFSLNLVQRKAKTASGAEKRFSVPLETMTGNESWTTIDSKLHFVDLAGSERLKNTGAQGDRAKEGISINAGLASLGKVISQLSSRQHGSHVSYRDSKLTRLLQDSLGGNAITYMIACVTPAEFHLSETLNTVQYAQRARAIQSKPQIQQVSDESDKQALIDRLKAEVAFLRDQIRSSERTGDGSRNGKIERPERQNEREMELQNQLLDTQENYTSLSQRHAKLISEMTKARDEEMLDIQAREGNLGASADERLDRSNSFAEAVEQVVLEYEKTIQSLEQSLSNTRSILSSTEASLLEKETKSAYVETVNHQLQARLQKMMDRESSTENYLQDLEAKLDGHTFGEEKNSAIITELRKEIARVRESEASCEDYISTLEERLAEADQDAELMQREIERLEHVVERQRSLGKLDNLLYELDTIQQDPKSSDRGSSAGISRPASANGKPMDPWEHSRKQSMASRRTQPEPIIENGQAEYDAEHNAGSRASRRSEMEGPEDNGEDIEIESIPVTNGLSKHEDLQPQSPAQSKFVQDKLENVTQELFDLRVEHESTVNEFDMLSAKYEEALRTLAELQDAMDETRRPTVRDSISSTTKMDELGPISFLADARVNELRTPGGQFSPSRSLSSELSSAGELLSTAETSDEGAAAKASGSVDDTGVHHDGNVIAELEKLRHLATERDLAHQELAVKYAQLEQQHQESLDVVEELKTQVSKKRIGDSPSRSTSPIIRRKSSQNVLMVDKAHRSFASLRNIAAENFENEPDTMQNFEINLNAAMHELHSRSERVQELEADLAAKNKEMETKMTIISGLTRERSSIRNSTTMDVGLVSQMREQLIQSENQIRSLQEIHEGREKQLLKEVEALKAAAGIQTAATITTASEDDTRRDEQIDIASNERKISELEEQLASEEAKHKSALESMKVSEKQLLATIAELGVRSKTAPTTADRVDAPGAFPVDTPFEENRDPIDFVDEIDQDLSAKHQQLIDTLQKELEQHRSAVETNALRVAELETAHATGKAQLEETIKARDFSIAELNGLKKDLKDSQALVFARSGDLEARNKELEEYKASLVIYKTQLEDYQKELGEHRELVANLQQQIVENEEQTRSHQASLAALHETHSREVNDIRDEHSKQLAEMNDTHIKHIDEISAATYAAAAAHEQKVLDLSLEHESTTKALQAELEDAQASLRKIAEHISKTLGVEVNLFTVEDQISNLARENMTLTGIQDKTGELQKTIVDLHAVNERVMREHESVKAELAALVRQTGEGAKLKTENLSISEQIAALKAELEDLETKNKKNSRLVEELEEQLSSNFDQHQMANNRLSSLQTERNAQLEEANANHAKVVAELETVKAELAGLQASHPQEAVTRANTMQAEYERVASPDSNGKKTDSYLRKSASVASLPSPPPIIPLPPLPQNLGSTVSPSVTNGNRSPTPPNARPGSKEQSASTLAQIQEDQEARIRTIEKHLFAEKQLTSTLEEALTDLEHQSNKVKADCDAWRRRASDLEIELKEAVRREEDAKKGRDIQENQERWSMNVVEEERKKRRDAELARQHLEERMNAINKKKKKGSLNCF